jgi:hypothetical protein
MNDEKGFVISKEFESLDFNSKRLEKRFVQTLETLSRNPEQSIWGSCETRAETKAIYNLLGNNSFKEEEVKRCVRDATIKRIVENGKTILAVQDTTGINYAGHTKTEGMGYNCDKTLGINLHTCLAVTPDGIALGILDQMAYTRPEKKDESATDAVKKVRPIEEKESNRWLTTMETSCKNIPDDITVINVCDREGDMYELFEKAIVTERLFLIRIVQNRLTNENKKIIDTIRKEPSKGSVTVVVPRDSRRNIKAREATLDVSFMTFDVKNPHILSANKKLKDNGNIIYVKERQINENISPIEWILATNEPVNDFEDAYQKVGYYIQRWKIERFHYVLKSGCKVEKIQERSYDKTTHLLLMYSFIAVMILNMTYIGRINPNSSRHSEPRRIR